MFKYEFHRSSTPLECSSLNAAYPSLGSWYKISFMLFCIIPRLKGLCIGALLGSFLFHPLVMMISHVTSRTADARSVSDNIQLVVGRLFSYEMLPWNIAFAVGGAFLGFLYTQIRQTKAALVESEEKFRHMTAAAQDAMIMVDGDGIVASWNEAAEKIFQYRRKEAEGKNIRVLFVPRRYEPAFAKELAALKQTGRCSASGKILEVPLLRRNGTEFPAGLSLSAVKMAGRWLALAIIRDISDLKLVEEEEELRRLSCTDGLTGLANRRHLD